MTNRTTRIAAAFSVVAGALLTSACMTPPAVPAQSSAPAQTPAQSPAPAQSTTPAQTESAPEPEYDLVAEGQDGSTWSFQIGEVRVVEADSGGDAAEAGQQLIEVTVDGQLLAGNADFYHAFHMYLVDSNGLEWGLSTGSAFYAEGDLYTTGTEEEFSGVGIYQVPADLTVEVVRFATDDGWSQDVQQ